MAQAIEREFQAIGDTEFVIDLAEVVFYDLFGGAYPNRNLFVLHALGDAGNDQSFFWCELDFGARSGGTQIVTAEGFHHPLHGLVLEPRFAGGNFAKALDEDFRLDLARQNAVGSSAEKVEGELLVRHGRDHNNFQLRRLAKEFRDSFDWIGN